MMAFLTANAVAPPVASRMATVFLQEMERELHALCQPVTALQCRLEMGQLLGDAGSMTQAVEGALVETERIYAGVARLRERLLAEEKEERSRWA